MMLASSCAALWMMVEASLTSASRSELEPVMLMRMPRAPSMAPASSSGEAMAACAAAVARFSPRAVAVPITAYPMPAMMVFTSAKSRLMMPGMVMMSEMPCTAWRRMSSATRNDSKKPASLATASSFSLGMTMVVSTESISSCRPRSAWFWRRLPSKANGLVTTATVRAPISLASEAMMGAAPVPVPPPSPVVTNTMSAPSRASMILSASSSAALRPTSGLAPAPRPLVSFTPSWILTGARESLQRLQVGVGDHELDAFEVRLDHAVDGVAAAAADADDLDLGAVDGVFVEMNANVVVGLLAEVFDHRLPRLRAKARGEKSEPVRHG